MNFTRLTQWIALLLSIKYGNYKTLLLKLVVIDLALTAHSNKSSDLTIMMIFLSYAFNYDKYYAVDLRPQDAS